ncbi:hypothetical protein MJG53_020338, partial [Ovis ammon polii x Ovis aries]
MPNRRASRNAYYFFVQEKIPELRRRGLPVARVADAIPYCSADWAVRLEARGPGPGSWQKEKGSNTFVFIKGVYLETLICLCCLFVFKALLGGIFYFLNIFSHGELPPHCEQRFLPCEIGCVKYSLQEGIMADFHSFINPGDSSHKIPISHFESGHDQATVLQNLYRFIHPNPGNWPPIYCKDLVVGIYQQKFLKEPSKTWVRSLLEVAMWDYSSNTRYCISNSLATLFGIQLTEAHVPLQDYEASNSVTPKMVVLDAGRYQDESIEEAVYNKTVKLLHFFSCIFNILGDYPSGVKIPGQNSSVRGRGITRLLESISSSSSNIHKLS